MKTAISAYAASIVAGAAVMAVEIIGTRIVGPVFGVDLFTWSALLAVTLLSLAAGYLFGGRLADKAPGLNSTGWALVVAGGCLALSMLLRRPWLGIAGTLGPRVGPLVSALVLFGPALAALGTIGPLAVRILTRELNETGRRVGLVYAVSTLGSFAATLIVGFLLIPYFETRTIVWGTALVVAATGAVLLVTGRRIAIAAIALLAASPLVAPERHLPDGFIVRARVQSLRGLLEVIDDEGRGLRALRADHSLIGAQWRATGTSCFDFVNVLALVLNARPKARVALQIGLGIGSLPELMAKHGVRSDVVEIDPSVVDLAKSFFGFESTGQVFAEDGRRFLSETTATYDIIVHDTFSGGSMPEHLLSREAFALVRARLAPGGLLALNFVGYQRGPGAAGALATLKTLQSAFKEVRALRDMPPSEDPDAPSNIVFFASDDPVTFDPERGADGKDRTDRTTWEVFRGTIALDDVPILSDELNPMAELQLPTSAAHFAAMRKLLPAEVWLD